MLSARLRAAWAPSSITPWHIVWVGWCNCDRAERLLALIVTHSDTNHCGIVVYHPPTIVAVAVATATVTSNRQFYVTKRACSSVHLTQVTDMLRACLSAASRLRCMHSGRIPCTAADVNTSTVQRINLKTKRSLYIRTDWYTASSPVRPPYAVNCDDHVFSAIFFLHTIIKISSLKGGYVTPSLLGHNTDSLTI